MSKNNEIEKTYGSKTSNRGHNEWSILICSLLLCIGPKTGNWEFSREENKSSKMFGVLWLGFFLVLWGFMRRLLVVCLGLGFVVVIFIS